MVVVKQGISLIDAVSRLVEHCYLTQRMPTPWAQSFTAVLQLMCLPLRVRIAVSNMFKLCSPVGSDLIVQIQVAYISSYWSIRGNLYLPKSCLARCVSSQQWDKIAFKLFKWILLVAGVWASFWSMTFWPPQEYLTQFKTSLTVNSVLVLSETVLVEATQVCKWHDFFVFFVMNLYA